MKSLLAAEAGKDEKERLAFHFHSGATPGRLVP